MCTELLCPLCNTSTFSDIDSFRYNLIKVNSKPLKCPLCFDTFLGLDKLTIHLFAHSLPPEEDIKEILQHNEQSQTLPSPQRTITSSSKKISSSPAAKVKQSRIKIVKMTSLASSSSSSAVSQEENFRCEICGFVFVDEQLLNLHLSLVHNFTPCGSGNNENGKQSLSQPSSPKGCGVGNGGVLAPEGGMKWNCHLCGKHFKMKGALRIHIRVAHVRFHDQNQKQINIADYLKSQKSSAIDLCTIKTELLSLQDPNSPSDNSLQQQQRYYAASSSPKYPSPAITPTAIVSAQSPSHCPAQQESVAKNSSKIFQCEECKKTFTTKYFLKKHNRLHTGK
jgi:ribosomal protein L37AE/L43A